MKGWRRHIIPFFENRQHPLDILEFNNMDFPEHLHTHIEITHIRSGQMRMTIEDKIYNMHQGDICIALPSCIHSYGPLEGQGAMGEMLLLSPTLAGEYYPLVMRKSAESAIIKKANAHPDIAYAIDRIMQEYHQAYRYAGDLKNNPESKPINGQWHEDNNQNINKDPKYIDPAIKTLLQLILARALPAIKLSDREESTSHDLLHKALDYISAHCLEPITLEKVAHGVGANKYYLSHLFSEKLKTNFRGYVNALRLSHAQQLLKTTDASITQVCFESGFENLRTFGRVFKAITGQTPKAYRKSQ